MFGSFQCISIEHFCQIYHYFIFIDATVIVFVIFISISKCLCLFYSNNINFCILILYPPSLPNSLIGSRSFFRDSIEFLHRWLCPLWIRFFFSHSFFYLRSYCVASTICRMLTARGESRHLCLVSNPRGKVFNLSR